jgi:hypothetical protein
MGASLVVQGAGAVAGGVAGGIVSRAITGEKQTAGAIATDAVVSGLTFGVIKGGGAIVRSLRGAARPHEEWAGVRVRGLTRRPTSGQAALSHRAGPDLACPLVARCCPVAPGPRLS